MKVLARSIIPCALIAFAWTAHAQPFGQELRFRDDFEGGLDRWVISGKASVAVTQSGDPAHGRVLVLSPNGDVHALIKGSDRWGGVRVEGDALFPSKIDSYLGFIYGFQKHGARADFGLVYIKGDGNYVQANPHYDYNVSRTFYPEFVTRLDGPAAVTIGRWQHFRLEAINGVAHLYVGRSTVPQMTFGIGAPASGAIGFQPRSVGGDVWLDNIAVSSIDRFSYSGSAIPDADYTPDSLLTRWEVAGPFVRTRDELAQQPHSGGTAWRPVQTDPRGAVVTARVVDYHGDRTVAYFKSEVSAPVAGPAMLHVSSVDDVAIWVNGRFAWFVPRTDAAWFDFWKTPAHAGRRIPVQLSAGQNDIVFRVRGGVYAAGGFFARLEDAAPVGLRRDRR